MNDPTVKIIDKRCNMCNFWLSFEKFTYMHGKGRDIFYRIEESSFAKYIQRYFFLFRFEEYLL